MSNRAGLPGAGSAGYLRTQEPADAVFRGIDQRGAKIIVP